MYIYYNGSVNISTMCRFFFWRGDLVYWLLRMMKGYTHVHTHVQTHH